METYIPRGKNWEIPPKIMATATTRLTMRLERKGHHISELFWTLIRAWGMPGRFGARHGNLDRYFHLLLLALPPYSYRRAGW